MFQRVGRRLALLNALIVIAVIVAVGGVTYVALQRSLNREIDNALRLRIEAVQGAPDSSLATATPGPSNGEDDEEHDDEEHDREVIDSGDTILITVDRDGAVISNPRAIGLDDVPVQAGIEAALAGKDDARSVGFEHGKVRVMTVPLYEDGQVVGAVQALRSLEEHESELTLMRRMIVFGGLLGVVIAIPAGLYLSRRAMQPINASFERQRAFVADASHELRTPLTLIRANADYALMDESKRVSETRPELTAILTEVDRTDRLVDDLLTLARSDAGSLHLEPKRQDLARLARETAEGMQSLFDAKGVRLELEAPQPVAVSVDHDRIVQVFRILLDNALRHTPEGGSVTVGVGISGHHAQAVVRDTGSGIAPEHVPHLFDRFYRADHSRSRAIAGTGLGLPIARALVEAHGGQIRIESEPGRGTAASFNLPLAHDEAGR